MNHYNLVFSTELLDEQVYNDVLDTLHTKCKQLHKNKCFSLADSGNHLVTVIRPVQELEEEKSQRESDLWVELTPDQETDSITHCLVPITESQTECPNRMLLQRLHEIAESLPQIGIFLDVYWLIKDEMLPSISENIELYGACKRLLEWNDADFKFVTLSEETKNSCLAEPWLTMMRGHMMAYEMLSATGPAMLWRGKVEIVGTNLRKPVKLAGFELRSLSQSDDFDDQITEEMLCHVGGTKRENQHLGGLFCDDLLPHLLSNKLEVIAQLDRLEIPLFYYTGNCCHLCIPSDSKLVDKARQFIQRLENNNRLCYLVRLCYGTSWKNIKDDKCYKNNEAQSNKLWSDFVQENIEHVLYCPVTPELDGKIGQHLILLCASSKDSDQPHSNEFICEAHLLRQPKDFNGNFTHQMTVSSLWQQKLSQKEAEENKKVAKRVISDLPTFAAKHLHHLRMAIKRAQITALQTWIDSQQSSGKSLNISQTDLVTLLQTAHSQTVDSFVKSYDYHKCSSAMTEVDDDDDDEAGCGNDENGKPSGECEGPVKELKRLILEFYSQTECKSNGSLAGLYHPQSRGKVVTLNAAEFLKFFKEDGMAAVPCSSELKLQKSKSSMRPMKLNFDDLKNITWPECESLQYHDIYYNQGITEEIEQRSRRLLSRLLTTETSSTCIYRQAHNPAILTVGTEVDHVKHEHDDEKKAKLIEERVTRSAVKRKLHEKSTKETKRLYAAKKSQVESEASTKGASNPKREATRASDADALSEAKALEKARRESRSQRHKRKLEEIVKQTLKKHGVKKDDPLFKACALRLYNITKSFVKDLTSSVGLRQEMERIAESNVQMIVDFERKNRQRTKK